MTWSMRRFQFETLIALTCGVGAGAVVTALTGFDVPLKVIALIIGALVGLIAALVTRDIKRLLVGLIFVDLATGFDVHLTCNENYFLSTCGFNISVTLLALIVLYGLWIISLRRGEAAPLHRPVLNRTGMMAAAFVWAAILSIIAAQNVPLALYQVWIYIVLFLLFFYLANNINSQSDVFFIVYMLVIGLTIQVGVMELEAAGVFRAQGMENLTSRIAGTFGHPNPAGSYLSQLSLLGLAILLLKLPRWQKPLIALVLLFALHSLIGTESRGGWLSFVAGGVVLVLVSLWKRWFSPKAIIISLLVVTVIFTFYSEQIIQRFTQDDKGAAEARGPLMDIAFNMIRANPVIGVGSNNFGVVIYDYLEDEQVGVWLHVVHNGWLLIWSEMGTIGFLAYAIFWALTVLQAIKLVRKGHPLYGILAVGVLASMTGAATHMMVERYGSRTLLQPLWTEAALITAMTYLQQQEAPIISVARGKAQRIITAANLPKRQVTG